MAASRAFVPASTRDRPPRSAHRGRCPRGPATLAQSPAGPLTYRDPVPESNETKTESGQTGGQASAHREPGPGSRARSPLEARRVLTAAAAVGRSDPWRILAVSIALSAAGVLAETAAEHLADHHSAWQAGVAAIITEGVGLLGTVGLSGFLCRLTGQYGQNRVTLGHVFRTLPWGRLIIADLIVTAAVLAGLIVLVIPGFIIATWLAVVGPLIEIEDQPVRAALRRSRRLVRHHFWSVALLATGPVIILTGLESAGPEPSGPVQFLEALAIRGVADGVLEAAFSLILIQLCYRLISLEAVASRARRADGEA